MPKPRNSRYTFTFDTRSSLYPWESHLHMYFIEFTLTQLEIKNLPHKWMTHNSITILYH